MHNFSLVNSPVTGRGGETRVVNCSWSLSKSVTKQKAKLKKFISENFPLSRTQETSIQIFARETQSVVPKWLILRQNETQHVRLDSPFYPTGFFTPTPRVCADSLSYSYAVTKFSSNDRLPIIFRYGTPRALTGYLVISQDLVL